MIHPLLLTLTAMAIGMTLIPVGDALAKYISEVTAYSPEFLAWSRFVVGGAIFIPIAIGSGQFRGLGKTFYTRQAIRGFLIAATLVLIITAVSISPLADVFGAFFIGPVIATVLAVTVLKEQATRTEWLAVVLGFIGVLLVVQPAANLNIGLLYALAAGVFYGSFLAATRWARASGPALAQLAAQLGFGFVFLLPLGFKDVASIGIEAPMLVLLMGCTSAMANLLSIFALSRARAAFLAPVVYLQIVVATLISISLFKDSINTLAITGLLVIILSGLMKIPDAVRSRS